MRLWPRQPSRQASGRPDPAAPGRSIGGRGLGDAAPRGAAGSRSDAGRETACPAAAGGEDRQTSQSLVAAKQFDIDGQIG
ncbi:hypothetical protein [Methylobacterium nonmethylotrophicum]|uniref:Uncharacterized protein n=1 Tax=Methylobacterium nonmethylotrophicum TaxID=1141884 RepID=A0A4Z0NKA5_9HYPH|nr:hypothetical protein [Methylobacterium nonmethylotrophicum]TGD96167.1 hypothetical protein EU555_24730 [Methylobacterium nonmethylotrophicum]